MRKICVITSTRAEYGIMSRLIDMLHNDKDIELQLIATGMHISDKFGNTYQEISTPITKKIDIEIESQPANAMSITISKFDEVFKELRPDIIVLLGDRYELLSVAVAAMLNNIPLGHIHGGETTEGAIDEAIRHSITKMSHIHFTSCEEYRHRVIQLGEHPETVFNVGSMGVENIKKLKLMTKAEFENSTGFNFNKYNLMVTFHPVTLENSTSKEQFKELLKALNELKDTNILFTRPNSDEGNQPIFDLIDEFVTEHKNSMAVTSLGVLRYLSALQFMNAVVGNSSSGIIEVPSFGIATVNIGDRQRGRLQAISIINCEPKKDEILNAISEAFKNDYKNTKNPYEKANSAENIVEILKTFDLYNVLKKSFYNINVGEKICLK